MGKNLSDTLIEYYEKGLLSDNPTINLLDLPQKKQLERGIKKSILDSGYFLTFAVCPYSDVKVGQVFDCIFPIRDVGQFLNVKATLKYVSINPTYETDVLYKGHSGICAFKFDGEYPDLLRKLPAFGLQSEPILNDFLIMTQKEIMEKLLNDGPYDNSLEGING